MSVIAELFPSELAEKRLDDRAPVEKMFCPDYGRPISRTHVSNLVANWDINAVGRVVLSMRPDGSFATIDGNHRVHAAIQLRIKELPATIFIDLTNEEEARLFRFYNNTRRLSALDKFRAKLEEGDPAAKEIVEALRRNDLSIALSGHGPGKLTAVASLETVHREFGMTILCAVLPILKQAFEFDNRAYNGSALLGMAMFCRRYKPPVLDLARLTDRLRQQSAGKMLNLAQAKKDAGDTLASGWGKAAHYLYNLNLRATKQLPEWKARVYGELALANKPAASKKAAATRAANRKQK